MDERRLRSGLTLAMASAIVLLVASFVLPWFDARGALVPTPGGGQSEVSIGFLTASNLAIPQGSLWQSTSVTDVVVFACVALTLAIGALGLSQMGAPSGAITALSVFGLVALVLIVYVAIAPPNNVDASADQLGLVTPGATVDEDDIPPIEVELSRSYGLLVGLLAALGMTVGGGIAARAADPAPAQVSRRRSEE